MTNTDDPFRSRKWRGLWIALGLVILVRAGEAFARLQWPAFSLGDLPWLILMGYGTYAGANFGTHWARARQENRNLSADDADKKGANDAKV